MPAASPEAAEAAPLLTPAMAAFICGGQSLTVSSCDERLQPSLAKGVTCCVSDNLREVTVIVSIAASGSLCRDLEQSGVIAVVACRPSTHETYQLKGTDARPVPLDDEDPERVRIYLAEFAKDLLPLGWGSSFVDTAFSHRTSDLRKFRFTPTAVFDQTPGPRAGARICRT
jgi:hypothetical protein